VHSVKGLTVKAKALGLTHPRPGRPMMKAEMHRILRNPLYIGEFRWLGTLHAGSHEPLITRDRFAHVQAMLARKPRATYPKQQHAFMGLLTCARCQCSITAERKKGKYTYYRCTGFHGKCGNAYIREETLSALLGEVVQRVQIPVEIADWMAGSLRDSQKAAEQARQRTSAQLTKCRQDIQAKLGRGYEDYLEGRISDAFWARKSGAWESELTTVEAELRRESQPVHVDQLKGEQTLELAKQAGFLYKSQSPAEQRRLLDTLLSNCTFDRGTLCPTYSKPFDLLVQGNETGNWRGRRDSNPLSAFLSLSDGARLVASRV
jgi:site-specific DNA recombinase